MTSTIPSLSSLLNRTTLDDHAEVLSAADAALKTSNSDIEAQHVKVVALLKLDRFDDALKVLEQGSGRLQARAKLEYTYALYKAGRWEEAERIAKDGTGRGFQHVFAQAAYRAEGFERAAQAYSQLEGERRDEEVADLRINSVAVDVQLEWAGKGDLVRKKPGREDLEAFETAFNAACRRIARGELGQGEVLLRRAKDLCNALEDLSDDEKNAETLPILVQQLYVLCRHGRTEDAERLASTVTCSMIPDPSTRYISQVNKLTASEEASNPYLSHRLFHSSDKLPKSDRPFAFQSRILRQNAAVIDMLCQKHAGVVRSTNPIINSFSEPTLSLDFNTASALNAIAHAQSHSATTSSDVKIALKAILPLLEKRPFDVGLLLTVIHLYSLTNNSAAAVQLMEGFFTSLEVSNSHTSQQIRFAPGLVGTLISLYSSQVRKSAIRSELAKAARYWLGQALPPSSLLKAAGRELARSDKAEDVTQAGKIFEKLCQVDPKDQFTAAGLVAAYSVTSPDKIAKEELDQLSSIGSLVEDIDATALEEAGVARPTPFLASRSRKRPSTVQQKPSKPKKIRKSRMPKDFEEGRNLDPERWLPMRDRSYYKPKGKKGKKRMEGLTQGGVEEEKKALLAEPAKGGGGGGQQKKKKKGKGGKW